MVGVRRGRRRVHSAGRSRRDLHSAHLSDRHADSDGRKRHLWARATRSSTRPDIFANTAVAGAYAASFGGFVSQSNVGQVHVWLKDGRKHPTSYWLAQFGKIARQVSAADVQAVVVPSTSTSGGNAQPIDFLVTDVTGGDPTPYAQQVVGAAAESPGRDQRQQHRHAARPRDLDPVRPQQGAGAGRRPRAGRAGRRCGLRRQRRDAVRNDRGPRAGPGNLSAVVSDEPRRAQVRRGPLVERRHRLSRRHRTIRIDADLAAHHAHRPQQRHSRQCQLSRRTRRSRRSKAGLIKRLPSLHLPPNIVVRPAPLGQQDFMHQTLVGMGFSMIVSVILVYLLMVALYNSYVSPFIIIFSVPVAAIGAIGALFLTHRTLNLFSLIGTILLDRHRDQERHSAGRLRQYAARARVATSSRRSKRARTRDSVRSS